MCLFTYVLCVCACVKLFHFTHGKRREGKRRNITLPISHLSQIEQDHVMSHPARYKTTIEALIPTLYTPNQVRHRKRHPRNKLGCYLVLGLSSVAMVLCTGAALVNMAVVGGRS